MPIDQIAAQREKRAAERDIHDAFQWGFYKSGPRKGCPKPKSERTYGKYSQDLAGFLTYAFPATFFKPHSAGQLADLELMQTVTMNGGQYAFAAPRGDGKSSRAEGTAIWAAGYGYHQAILLIGSEQDAANEMLDSIKMEFRANERLCELFPWIGVPAMEADDVAIKARAMTFAGQDMHFRWGAKRIFLPTIPGAPSSGTVIVPRGLTSRIRGIRFKHVDGRTVRPSLMLPDDPQTDKSAYSPGECDKREKLITAAIMGTGGHGKPPTALMPCTVIREGDMAHSILDREVHPEWHGRTRGMVQTWPTEWGKDEHGLWGEYIQLRKGEQRGDQEPGTADAFYKVNRGPMDAGAAIDWVLDSDSDATSAMQYAANLWCDRGEAVFMAEYQNEPTKDVDTIYELDVNTVISRTSKQPRRVCPESAQIIVVFCDINHYGLHWCCVAFQPDMTASVLDYGKYPKRGGLVQKNASDVERNHLIFAGLTDLGEGTLAKLDIKRGGDIVHPNLLMVDRGYAPHTVHQYVKHQKLPFNVLASRGYGSSVYRPTPRNTIGAPRENCHMTKSDLGQYIAHNADAWRETAQRAFLPPTGAPTGVTLYATDPIKHKDFAEHICAEVLQERAVGEREVLYKWAHRTGYVWDWLDALVGCYVGAAWFGLSATGTPRAIKKKKKGWRIRK